MSPHVSLCLPTSVSELRQKSLNTVSMSLKRIWIFGCNMSFKSGENVLYRRRKKHLRTKYVLKRRGKSSLQARKYVLYRRGKCSLYAEKESFKKKICPLKSSQIFVRTWARFFIIRTSSNVFQRLRMSLNVSKLLQTSVNISELLLTSPKWLKTTQTSRKLLENGQNVIQDIKIFLVQEFYSTKKFLDLWV